MNETFQESSTRSIRLLSWHPYVSIHIGEIQNHEQELLSTLQYKPLRIGHSLYYVFVLSQDRLLQPTSLYDAYKEHPFHIEICPTSNIKTLGLKSLQDHPLLPYVFEHSIPFSINTDDSSVFQTTISKEMALFMKSFRVSKLDVMNMEKACIEYIMDPSLKEALLKYF